VLESCNPLIISIIVIIIIIIIFSDAAAAVCATEAEREARALRAAGSPR
jgi:hypothetical protein